MPKPLGGGLLRVAIGFSKNTPGREPVGVLQDLSIKVQSLSRHAQNKTIFNPYRNLLPLLPMSDKAHYVKY